MKKEIITYENKKCIICNTVFTKCILISLSANEFIICFCCARELKEELMRDVSL